MKRGSLVTTILLSFVVILSLGVVSATCGDDYWNISAGEACDDGNTVNETECAYGTTTCITCNAECTANLTLTGSYCGDDTEDTSDGEQCDDGNAVNDDGCSNTCGVTFGPGTSIEDINVPITGMCSGSASGLLCNETAAENYCIDVLNYGGYVAGSKTCDAGGHTTGNLANHDINPSIGLCYNSDGDGDGTVNWTTQIQCYTTTAAQDCVDSDADAENPYFEAGGVTVDGGATYENDSCTGGTLTEYFCEAGLVKFKSITCSAGCHPSEGECKIPETGLLCSDDDAINPAVDLNKVAPNSRQRGGDGVLYYCGLDLDWHPAKPTVDDISCIAAGTCPVANECFASYECISNSCVDEYCISITGELQEQRGFLVRIWCFLTNMGDFFDFKVDYCGCVMDDASAFWNSVAEECTI